jgi:glycerate-2-kinase
MALAAAQVLSQAGERGAGIRLLAAGTDGRDGQTDAAGTVIDGESWNRMVAAAADPAGALQRHESNRALGAINALLPRRDTGTNVMDVAIGLVG